MCSKEWRHPLQARGFSCQSSVLFAGITPRVKMLNIVCAVVSPSLTIPSPPHPTYNKVTWPWRWCCFYRLKSFHGIYRTMFTQGLEEEESYKAERFQGPGCCSERLPHYIVMEEVTVLGSGCVSGRNGVCNRVQEQDEYEITHHRSARYCVQACASWLTVDQCKSLCYTLILLSQHRWLVFSIVTLMIETMCRSVLRYRWTQLNKLWM